MSVPSILEASLSPLTFFLFPDILNALDGINERTGQRIFWTTNIAESSKHFDPAFLRPGRMDMIVKLHKCIKHLVSQYFKTKISDEKMDLMFTDLKNYIYTHGEIKHVFEFFLILKT